MIEKLRFGAEVDDIEFDALFPLRWRKISKLHFSPVKVAQTAAEFLVQKPGDRVLDIGSGVGKFCMIGAACTKGYFVGVEQRRSLYNVAKRVAKRLELTNIEFVHSDFAVIDFKKYDAIYFFNSFYENVVQTAAIDQTVAVDRALYAYYNQHMKAQLEKMPVGTRLATYFSFLDEVPDTYKIKATDFELKLKLWEKVD